MVATDGLGAGLEATEGTAAASGSQSVSLATRVAVRAEQAIAASPKVANSTAFGLGVAKALFVSGTYGAPDPSFPLASMNLRYKQGVAVGMGIKLALHWLH